MNPLSFFKYPAYLYNPRQVLSRVRRHFSKPSENDTVRLPWGHELVINSNDFIGRAIWTQGIHEINVCEAIARLVREGDTTVDAGANVGFITSLLAKAVGKSGDVLAFEPHPNLYSTLRENIDRFSRGCSGRVTAQQIALSDCEGEATLVFNSELFSRNSGTAGLRDTSFASGNVSVKVRTKRLDDFIKARVVALLKIDVEGAELQVLQGTERALGEHRIKAVVYEDFNFATSGIAEYLMNFGFSVFHLAGSVLRPRVSAVVPGFRQIPRGRDENFLAVLDAQIALQAYRPLGWRVFSL